MSNDSMGVEIGLTNLQSPVNSEAAQGDRSERWIRKRDVFAANWLT